MIIMLKILRSWKINKVGLNEKEKFQTMYGKLK